MCWFGITGTFTVAGEAAGTKLNIQGFQTAIFHIIPETFDRPSFHLLEDSWTN